MTAATAWKTGNKGKHSPVEIARELGPLFARRAAEAADEDRFVADNFATLKSSGLVEAGVPSELGGGGSDVDELAATLRTLGYHCGSTALAFSMSPFRASQPARYASALCRVAVSGASASTAAALSTSPRSISLIAMSVSAVARIT